MAVLALVVNYPSGTVAVTHDEIARFSQFAICMQGLQIPGEKSKTIWQQGNDISGARNRAVELLDGEWLWWIDDDHAFHPNIIMSLLDQNVDVVAPLVLRRQQPFDPVSFVQRETATQPTKVLPLHDLKQENALVEVEACGTAGMLVRRQVFEHLTPPYFRMTDDGISEDIYFCDRVREAGFKIHVHTGTPLAHLTVCAIWPTFAEGEWRTGFTIADGFKLQTGLLWTQKEASP